MGYTSWPNGAEIAFAIRDDDISFFTPPEKLERLYEKAWQKGFKVSFSTIPMHRATMQPNVPPESRGHKGKVFNIKKNKKLVKFLKSKVKDRKADILLHGYFHDNLRSVSVTASDTIADPKLLSEFYDLPKEVVKRRLQKGKQLLEQIFNTSITVFAPPNYYLNNEMLQALQETNLACNCAMNSELLKRFLFKATIEFCKAPFRRKRTWIFHLAKSVLSRESTLQPTLAYLLPTPFLRISYILGPENFDTERNVTHLFKTFKKKFQDLRTQRSYFILNTHYHTFFYDWEERITQKRQKEVFDKIIGFVATQDKVWKCTVSDILAVISNQR
ncbi:MAG: DUF2334 domain-containing protein [Candidatus Korarchaeota archaeon]|nr:DUF2334 domain-containing protein [Candidatus Korarchaeota archaeon]NIU84402.1 DUF2334 domain-containing protein [Candidatus Thorarchaeota archaeon]NIW14511.1 DUF2334 domain-containing protein [Candidatus Thorarchaeota archaeon]NIW52590.1 DUF2334 domain-containing protein [Candidatus Korarchaeota archaeon]